MGRGGEGLQERMERYSVCCVDCKVGKRTESWPKIKREQETTTSYISFAESQLPPEPTLI